MILARWRKWYVTSNVAPIKHTLNYGEVAFTEAQKLDPAAISACQKPVTSVVLCAGYTCRPPTAAPNSTQRKEKLICSILFHFCHSRMERTQIRAECSWQPEQNRNLLKIRSGLAIISCLTLIRLSYLVLYSCHCYSSAFNISAQSNGRQNRILEHACKCSWPSGLSVQFPVNMNREKRLELQFTLPYIYTHTKMA